MIRVRCKAYAGWSERFDGMTLITSLTGFNPLTRYFTIGVRISSSENSVERIILTPVEAHQAVDNAILDSGFSLEELQEQANNHRFESVHAKLCWMVISTLGRQSHG